MEAKLRGQPSVRNSVMNLIQNFFFNENLGAAMFPTQSSAGAWGRLRCAKTSDPSVKLGEVPGASCHCWWLCSPCCCGCPGSAVLRSPVPGSPSQ